MATTDWQRDVGFSDRLLQTKEMHQSYGDLCLNAIQGFNDEATAAAESDREQRLQSGGQASTVEEDEEDSDAESMQAIGRYTHVRHHKDGLFSTIFKAKSPESHQWVALKVTNVLTATPPHNPEREAQLLRRLSHPHIIPLLESFRQPGHTLVLALPFLPTTLEHILDAGSPPAPSTDQRMRAYLYSLFDALDYLHSQGIIHRDVKPANILIDGVRNTAYLADFGIVWSPAAAADGGDGSAGASSPPVSAASEPADRKITDVGTTSYRPPELLFGCTAYGTKLDMWAAGCVVAEAVAALRRPLFDSGPVGSELALIRSIFSCLGTPTAQIWPEAAKFRDWGKVAFHNYPAKSWAELLPGASEAARDLVSKLVCFESALRLTAVEAKSHEFFGPDLTAR